MATVLHLDRTGATVEIIAADGEIHHCRLTPARPGLDAWAVWLERSGGDETRRYRVGVGPDGLWRCTCPDWRYRHHPSVDGGCKHVEAARDIRDFVEQVTS